ncbi:uncharacterized protein [Oryza sativa Japonica Group]|uniref:uncharacterized protein n=1 Tax=Oryza sativa subsp. japonica TaxID=39947 RepID=UPI00339BAD30
MAARPQRGARRGSGVARQWRSAQRGGSGARRRRGGAAVACRGGGVAWPGIVARLHRHCRRDVVAGGGRIEVRVSIVGAAESCSAATTSAAATTRRPAAPPPASSRGRTTSPRLLLLSLRRRPASSRLSLLARAPSGRAVFSLGLAGASSSPAPPSISGEIAGDAPPPATVALPPLFLLRPPLPRLPCAGRRRHHLSRHRNAVLFPGQATASPVFRRNTVVPRRPLHPPRRNFPGRPRRRLLRHRSGKVVLGIASPPSKPLRGLSSSSPFVLVVDVPSVARLVVSLRRHRYRHHSGVFHAVLVSVQPLPAALVASSPAPVSSSSSSRRSWSSWRSSLRRAVPVRRPRPSSEPRQPRRRLRPRLRVVKRCAGCVSPSSKDRRRSRSLAVCLRRSRAVSAAPVRRHHSHASSRGGKGL